MEIGIQRGNAGTAFVNLDPMIETIRRRVGDDSGLDGVIKIDLGDDGAIYIDARDVPNEVGTAPREADCTFALELDDLRMIVEGRLGGITAFASGKLGISGDMGIAARLRRMLA